MARKKSSKEKRGIIAELKEETKHHAAAIAFFAFAAFFVLAAWGKSGLAGNVVFRGLDALLGIGYAILPLALLLLGISFFRSNRPELAATKMAGGVAFFLSALGIIAIVLKNNAGGMLGSVIATPLVKLFDVYTSLVFLSALLVISLLFVFDTKITLSAFAPSFLKKKPRNEDEEDEEEEREDEEEYEESEDEDDEEDEEEEGDEEDDEEGEEDPEPKEKKRGLFARAKTETPEDDIPLPSPLPHQENNPPPLSLLTKDKGKPGVGDIKANANIIKRTLANFGITVEMDEVTVGPSVTRYALKPAEGVKLSRIVGLQNDLGLALAAHPIRIEAPIPGKSLVGIEVPNNARATIGLANLIGASEYKNSPKPLLFALGKNIAGKSFYGDLAKLPHLLIAGATGSGKSVTIHAIITSLLYRNAPENLRFIMVDPKRVELTLYKNIPHLLTPVITDAKKAILALKWAAKEMDRRYDILETESVRDIASYHRNIVAPAYKKRGKSGSDEEAADLPEKMPYIVIVIDELADIMTTYPREMEAGIVRLAQMSRAVGIHLVISTQRPSVNVITGLIKANIPGRVALQVASQIDSRTILDAGGAEKLLGAGDMLYLSGEMSQPQRLQSAFVTEDEVKKIVKYLAGQYEGEPGEELHLTNGGESEGGGSIFESLSDEGDEEDELYGEAYEAVVRAGKASTSYLQRRLKVGYARAARLMDMLEERGVVGPADGAKPREVLAGPDGGAEETEAPGDADREKYGG